MAAFHALSVSDIRKETEDTVSVAFDIPEGLEETFKYKQGQYITFKKDINGEELRRSYSVCSSPLDGELRVAIKQVPEGRFSTYANHDLGVGDVLEVMPPDGRFYTEVDPEQEKDYVAFAAGSGITPILSIIKTVLAKEPKSRFMLFYGNKTQDSIIFKKEIEGLKNTYMDRLAVYHVISRENLGTDLFHGRIDEEKINKFIGGLFSPSGVDEFFLCGPEEMIMLVSERLKKEGVAKEKIHFELFTTPTMAAKNQKSAQAEKNTGSVESNLKVVLDGEEVELALDTDGTNILDAALEAGMDVPYACKGAVCMTCRGKVLEGSVKMDLNFALTDQEVEEGYVLTCQSHPTSEKCTVSFDD